MKRAVRRPRVAILGCGHVGEALATELLFRGRRMLGDEPLRVWSRSGRSARGVGRLGGMARHGVRVMASPGQAAEEADVLLLCVADSAIPTVVGRLAWLRAAREHPGVMLMTNGFLPLSTLQPLMRLGWSVGRMHPLSPVPAGAEETSPLHRSRYALEGDARAVRAARRIVRGIGGIPFVLAGHSGAAQAYHAGASLLCGGLVALFHQTERALARSFEEAADVRPALAHLVGNTLWYTWTGGPQRALTGAVSRGSEALVRGHLQALKAVPQARALYCLLGETMLELARTRGSIDAETQRRLLRLLRREARRR